MKQPKLTANAGVVGVGFFLAGLGGYYTTRHLGKKKPTITQQISMSAAISGVGIFVLGRAGYNISRETAYLGALAGSLVGINYQKSKSLGKAATAAGLTTLSAYALLKGITPVAKTLIGAIADKAVAGSPIIQEALTEMNAFFGPGLKKNVNRGSISTGVAIGLTGLAIPHVSKLANSFAEVPEGRGRSKESRISLMFSGEHNEEVRSTGSNFMGF